MYRHYIYKPYVRLRNPSILSIPFRIEDRVVGNQIATVISYIKVFTRDTDNTEYLTLDSWLSIEYSSIKYFREEHRLANPDEVVPRNITNKTYEDFNEILDTVLAWRLETEFSLWFADYFKRNKR